MGPSLFSDFYFDIYTGGELELHEGIHRFGVAILYVEKPAVRIEPELLTSLLVYEGGAVYRKYLFVGGKGNRTIHLGACRLYGLDNLGGRLVYQHVVEGLEFNSDFLTHIACKYNNYSSSIESSGTL